jgi:hypothetical protein
MGAYSIAVLVVAGAIGAVGAPYLDPDSALVVASVLILVSIALGWYLMFDSRAVRFVGFFRFWGPFAPVWSGWVATLRESWALLALFAAAGLLAGGCVRVLFLAQA